MFLTSSRISRLEPPVDDLFRSVATIADGYAVGPDLVSPSSVHPEMAKNPLYQPDQSVRPVEPEFSLFWTTTDSQERPPYAIFGLKDNVNCLRSDHRLSRQTLEVYHRAFDQDPVSHQQELLREPRVHQGYRLLVWHHECSPAPTCAWRNQ